MSARRGTFSGLDDQRPYPLTLLYDRYNGVYSGGRWTAWNLEPGQIPAGPEDGDPECREFWSDNELPVGRGDTPDTAIADLVERIKA